MDRPVSLPLRCLTVLVTRAESQSQSFAALLESAGASPVLMPAIAILHPDSMEALDAALLHLADFDWVAFTSVNGVEAFTGRAVELRLDASVWDSVRLASVGPATAGALARRARYPDWIAQRATGLDLGRGLPEVDGKRVLLPRGDLARFEVAQVLRQRGAEVTEIEAYRTIAAAWPEQVPKPDLITFLSSSSVLATHERLAERGLLHWMQDLTIACIGPVTARTVEDLGYQPSIIAADTTVAGLVAAISEAAMKGMLCIRS